VKALLWLWWRQRWNALIRWARRFRRPREIPRALLPVVAIGLVGFAMLHSRAEADLPPEAGAVVLGGVLAGLLLFGALGGLSDRGVAFTPAEVDFLFPAPVPSSALVLYHLLGSWSRSLGLGVLLWLLFGSRTPSPAGAAIGILLVLLTMDNLRLCAAWLSLRLAEKVVARIRGPLRVLALAAVVGVVLLFVPGMSGDDRATGVVRVVESGGGRFVLYPAFAAADLASATAGAVPIGPLLGLLACVVGSLALLVALQVPFLEASIGTSERRTAALSRVRRGRPGAMASTPSRATPVRLPPWRLFRGPGAILWRNLLVARRSGRALLFTSAYSLLFLVPAFLARDRSPVAGAAFGAALPLFLSSTLSFDFRAEGLHMATLKSLPASPTRIAMAEVAGSSLVALVFQGVLLVALVAFADLPAAWAPLLYLAYVPTTVALLGTANLGFLLAGRAPGLQFLLQIACFAVDAVLLAGVGSLVHALGVGFEGMVLALATAQMGFALLVLRVVGAAFARYDASREVA
jgi:ABC-2 type transport system permease protein